MNVGITYKYGKVTELNCIHRTIQAVTSTLAQKVAELYTVNLNTLSVKRNFNHFFRVTFTEIHCIKMIHIWTQLR